MSPTPRPFSPFVALLIASTLLFAARLYAASTLGYGDAEALYATYALHPAPAYVDHPGLVAVLAALIGHGSVPSPRAAHVVTSVLATLVPWLAFLAARLAGAPRKRAAQIALVFALVPELAIGLFGLTPDLPFASFTLLTIGLVSFAARATRDDWRGDLALLAAGVCAGLACLAKLPGLALLPWLAIATVRRRPGWLVAASTSLALLLFFPVVRHELAEGAPMLAHRFLHTQTTSGFSLRNFGALLGGQLAYVTPSVVIAACLVARAGWRRSFGSARDHRTDAVTSSLFLLAALFAVPLALLCLWSRVAEPHWLAPAYLPLAIAWARRPDPLRFPRAVGRTLVPISASLVVLVHAYVLTDLFPRLAGASYEGRYDLANDMRMFPAANETLHDALRIATLRGPTLVVVAPHWTIAAQLATVLPPGTRITTASPLAEDDDFRRWIPADERDAASVILYVTDDRFAHVRPPFLERRVLESERSSSLVRGGRDCRVLSIRTYGAARAVSQTSLPTAPR